MPSLPPDTRAAPIGRVDLNLLLVFDAVMMERHVTRAAERLEMTQSAVSNALNRLRKLYEDQLFVKAPRGVNPTPRANALWPRIHQALAELLATVRPGEFDAHTHPPRYRIAMVDITASLITPHLYRLVYAIAPKTKLFYVPHDPDLTGPRLMRGELDFALSIEPPRASVLQSIPLWSDSFVVAGRRGNPLLERKMSLARFCAASHLVVNEPGSEEYSDLVDEALQQRGLARSIALSVNHFSVAREILATTDLIGVLPTRFAANPMSQEELAIQPIPLHTPEVVVHLAWHQRNAESPAHMWLRQKLMEAAAAMHYASDKAD